MIYPKKNKTEESMPPHSSKVEVSVRRSMFIDNLWLFPRRMKVSASGIMSSAVSKFQNAYDDCALKSFVSL